jgi:hypothetical protein
LLSDGKITAAAASGQGGNVNLKTDNLQLDGGEITATAGKDGDGGNVTINTTTLLAKKNSQITANAFAGTGGNIQVNTRGLFLFPNSIIDASSELGIDGTVKIRTLDTKLQRELELSKLNLITTETSLTNSCLARRNQQQGSLVISNASSSLNAERAGFFDSGSITGVFNFSTSSDTEQLPALIPQSSDSLIPAQQAVKTQDGRIFLVSSPQSVKSLICN